MEKLVKIYVLIDPITLKVKYIGRTISPLKKRLAEHLAKAKSFRHNTHKDNWLRSIIKINSKPYIKQIAEIKGWNESYIFESNLIEKYKDRILNHDDKGPGCLRTFNQESKDKISKSLKDNYKNGMINVARKKIYVYNLDGSFYKEYDSIRIAAIDLGYYFKVISKRLKCTKLTFPRKGKQFSLTKVDKMYDYTSRKDAVLRRNSKRLLLDKNGER